MTQLKSLEAQLASDITNQKKGEICLQIAQDYSVRHSLDFEIVLEKGLALKNIDPEVKCELLFLKLKSLINFPDNFSPFFLSTIEFIKEHKLGPERKRRINFIKTIPFFKKREYEKVKEGYSILLKENFNKEVLSEYDKNTKLSIIYYLAWSEKLTGNFQESLSYFEQHRELCLALKKYVQVAVNFDNVANLFANDKNYEKAQIFMEESLRWYEKYDNMEYATKTYLHIAGNQMNIGNLNEAVKYYYKTIEFAEFNNDLVNRIFCWNNLSRIAIMQNDYESFKDLGKVLETHLDFILKDRVTAISFCRQSTEGFLKFNELDKALHWADKFESYQSGAPNILDLERIYSLKIELYKKLENKEKEIEYLEKFLALKDKILEQAKRKAVEEFEAKFQNQQKESKIQELKLESVSFQLQSLRSQMNPHFVFNTIASITEKLHTDNIDSSKVLLRNFARIMRSNLNFAEEEKISLEDEIQFLNDYLSLQQNSYSKKFDFEINYPSDMDLDFIDIPSMLIQPYIENAIKHGIGPLLDREGLIKIAFKEVDEYLICTILDNGIGRKLATEKKNFSNHKSKSTKITAKRLHLLNEAEKNDLVYVEYNDLEELNGNASGTEVILKIKL